MKMSLVQVLNDQYALYSFPVCGASFFSTSPGLTCFRAGFNFFCFFTTAACVSVMFELIVGLNMMIMSGVVQLRSNEWILQASQVC